ncbi:hypothetical protein [Tabrizicola sp.]|uniref:hypothetical protein n=1 Tax=Tabrizicola sp. TaxID=2005166 RepID=UPI003F2A12F2
MIGSKSAQDRLSLTLDLQQREEWVAQGRARSSRRPFEKLQRFPPIEDLVTALDMIASRTTNA